MLDIETHETQRLWQSSPPFLEDTGSLLNDRHDQAIKYGLLSWKVHSLAACWRLQMTQQPSFAAS